MKAVKDGGGNPCPAIMGHIIDSELVDRAGGLALLRRSDIPLRSAVRRGQLTAGDCG